MFVLLPLRLNVRDAVGPPPLVNGCLIALNVLCYLLSFAVGGPWVVGPGTGLLSIVLYGFSHAGFWHLLFNMWALWVFGNPVNRRLGNLYYGLAYLGTIVVLGLFARLFCYGYVVGASGGIFAVITIACLLMPAEKLEVAYGAIFPLSVLIGLIRKPKYGIYWFVCGGQFQIKALFCLFFIPLLELVAMLFTWSSSLGGVWNLGHLLGMFCGVAIVLLLPRRISMKRRQGTLRFGD